MGQRINISTAVPYADCTSNSPLPTH
ncbi:unnamed protein product [Spirodela intermedia]|uniref:Uncharacterized protein n=1 Tax=Spirodela intermedia TaxID=51605 RepID=A0A7I8KS57_SPIIN|nr:unnamed protein product [Spirodela intermedia]